MQTYKGKGIGKDADAMYRVTEFESMPELIDHVRRNEAPAKSNRYDLAYNLTQSLDAAIELATSGWHDIRSRVDGHLEPLREELGETLKIESDRVYDLVGVEPDIARFLAGEMECMIDDVLIETPKEGKVFRMVVDCSMTWNNSPEDIAKRGAVLCALVEAYILLGFQLELWTEYTTRGYDNRHGFVSFVTRLNRAGDLVDIDALMFAIGHPDYGRRLMWSCGEQNEWAAKHMGFNANIYEGYYGLQRNGVHHAERLGASSMVSLDGNKEMTRDPMGWILSQLEMQGIYNGGDN